MAGTGKSTIAYSICKYLDEEHPAKHLGASFFCSRQVPELRERKFIIPSIAYQLSRRSRTFAKALSSTDVDKLNIRDEHINEFLALPWKSSVSEQPSELLPFIIVIDALDEIEDLEGSILLEGLINAISTGMHGIKILVTSRPDPRISEVCGGLLALYDHSEDNALGRPEPRRSEESGGSGSVYDYHLNNTAPGHPEPRSSKARDVPMSLGVSRLEDVSKGEATSDILLFLKASLQRLMPNHSDELAELSQRSEGLFIYAATCVRFICPSQAVAPSLAQQHNRLVIVMAGESLQPTKSREAPLLDLLYRQILNDTLLDEEEDIVTHRRRVLYTIICAQKPLSTFSLAGVVAGMDEAKKADLEATEIVVGALHSVLYVSSNDGLVYTYHKSFPDFLSNMDRAGKEFVYNSEDWNLNVGRSCLAVMTESLQFNCINWPSSFRDWYEMDYPQHPSETLLGNFPGLEYAIKAWVPHFQELLSICDFEKRDIANLDVMSFLESKTFLLWLEANVGFMAFLGTPTLSLESLRVLLDKMPACVCTHLLNNCTCPNYPA